MAFPQTSGQSREGETYAPINVQPYSNIPNWVTKTVRFTSGWLMWELEQNVNCLLNSWKKLQIFFWKKRLSGSFFICRFFLFPFIFSLFLFLLLSPVSRFWHVVTVTVVYKSPFPWTVSACLFWDETKAIRSSSPQTPAFLCSVSLPNPHNTQQSTAARCRADISNHLVCFQANYR